jgi:hypothetical protein
MAKFPWKVIVRYRMALPSHVLVAGAFQRMRHAPTGVLPVAPVETGMIA